MENSNSKQNCYCDTITNEFREKEKIPEGFCGLCEICGKPGHTQQDPNGGPSTGAWCDVCAEALIASKVSPLFTLLFLVIFLAGVIWGFLT